jgi:lysophospholipase L1-like esterase
MSLIKYISKEFNPARGHNTIQLGTNDFYRRHHNPEITDNSEGEISHVVTDAIEGNIHQVNNSFSGISYPNVYLFCCSHKEATFG